MPNQRFFESIKNNGFDIKILIPVVTFESTKISAFSRSADLSVPPDIHLLIATRFHDFPGVSGVDSASSMNLGHSLEGTL